MSPFGACSAAGSASGSARSPQWPAQGHLPCLHPKLQSSVKRNGDTTDPNDDHVNDVNVCIFHERPLFVFFLWIYYLFMLPLKTLKTLLNLPLTSGSPAASTDTEGLVFT